MTPEAFTAVAQNPSDVVAHVCYGLGYRPRESLVLVGVRAGRTGGLARGDLPPPVDRHAIAAVTEGLAERLVAVGADRVVAVVFAAGMPERPEPYRGVLTSVLSRVGPDVVMDVVGVGPDGRHGSLLRDDPGPAASLAGILDSPVALQAVVAGTVLHEDAAGLVSDVVVPGARPAAADPPRSGGLRPERCWNTWCRALAGGDFPPGAAFVAGSVTPAGFAAALRDHALRGAVTLSALGVPPARCQDPAEPWPVDLLGVRPERVRLEVPRRLLARAAREAGPDGRRSAVTVLAMQAWFLGDGFRARMLVELAEAAGSPVPDGAAEDELPVPMPMPMPSPVPLLGLVRAAVDGGLPPPWAGCS